MKHTLQLFIVFAILLFTGCSKEEEPGVQAAEGPLCLVEINGNFVETELDEMPVFLNGGEEGFYSAILEVAHYPTDARAAGIEGRCVLHYEITETGEVENIEVVQDPGGGIGASAKDALAAATAGPAFSPAMLNGAPVRVRKSLDIDYGLE